MAKHKSSCNGEGSKSTPIIAYFKLDKSNQWSVFQWETPSPGEKPLG